MRLIAQKWRIYFVGFFLIHAFCAPAFTQSPTNFEESDGEFAERIVRELKEQRARDAAEQNSSPSDAQALWNEIQNLDGTTPPEEDVDKTRAKNIVVGVSAAGGFASSLFSLTVEPRDLPSPYSQYFSPAGLNFSISAVGIFGSCALAITTLQIARKLRK